MLKQTTKTKYGYNVKYIRDNWKEWFVMKIEQGGYMPFYLPVKHDYMTNCSTAWIWYLIPIVIPIYLIKELVLHVFKDTRQMLNDWIKYNNLTK